MVLCAPQNALVSVSLAKKALVSFSYYLFSSTACTALTSPESTQFLFINGEHVWNAVILPDLFFGRSSLVLADSLPHKPTLSSVGGTKFASKKGQIMPSV